jgi:hypothetical protein
MNAANLVSDPSSAEAIDRLLLRNLPRTVAKNATVLPS